MSSENVRFEVSFGQEVTKTERDELISALENAGARVTPKEQQAIDADAVIIVLKIIAAGFNATKAGLELAKVIRDWRGRQRRAKQSVDVKLRAEKHDVDVDLNCDSDEEIDRCLQP